MRPTQLHTLVLAALTIALGGCLSGQTGSPDPVPVTECLCDTLYSGGNLLRVHGQSSADGKLTAVVDRDIADVYRASPLAVGDLIAGPLLTEKPCARGVTSADLAGADLLVFFYHSAPSSTSGQGSPGGLLDGVFKWAVPWSDTLDFGADHLLAGSELDVLSSPEACAARFPYDAAPARNDVNAGLCSVAQLNPQPTYPFTGLLGIVLLGALRRRRTRAQRSEHGRAVRRWGASHEHDWLQPQNQHGAT
jgi:MYXO-CTERM domain-containing protein